jgi:UDP-N-acetylmuramoylalanine--D-glutamate ligase
VNAPRPAPASTLVVGLGRTGASLLAYLERRGLPAAGYDDAGGEPVARTLRARPGLPVAVGAVPADWWERFAAVWVSPGVPSNHPVLVEARRRGLPVEGDIELFARAARAPVLAVTGTNGKSTVVALLGAMATRAGRRTVVGGNYGTPALDLLTDPEPELYVLELSSFQLELTTSLRTRASAVLNLTEDHLDRHESMDAYAAAKERIFHATGLAVGNRDDAYVRAMLERCSAPRLSFGAGPPEGEDYGLVDDAGDLWLVGGRRRLLAARELLLVGRHNLLNVLAAWALAEAAGLPEDAVRDAARAFPGLPHRMRVVGERGGVRYYDDSKATNVGATVAALRALERPIVAILGGRGKGQSFAPLAEAARGRLRAAVLIGEDAPAIARALDGVCPLVNAADMDEAVRRASALARSGDAVLLAPACASFDMFRDYADRGERFRAAVEAFGATGVEAAT